MARTSREADGYIAGRMEGIAVELDARDLMFGLYRDPLRASVGDLIFTRGAVDAAEITVEHLLSLTRDLKMDADKSSEIKGEIDEIERDLRNARVGCSNARCHIVHVTHGMRSIVTRLSEAIEQGKRACAATSSAGHYEVGEAMVFA